jgi:hypothetical protein
MLAHESLRLEAVQQAAQLPAVDRQGVSELAHLGDVVRSELVQHPCFGEWVLRLVHAVAGEAETGGVEAVELANGGDVVGCGHGVKRGRYR